MNKRLVYLSAALVMSAVALGPAKAFAGWGWWGEDLASASLSAPVTARDTTATCRTGPTAICTPNVGCSLLREE